MIYKNINPLLKYNLFTKIPRSHSKKILNVQYSSSTSHSSVSKPGWKDGSSFKVLKKAYDATTFTGSLGLVLLGTGVIGILLYSLGEELWNGDSQTNLFNQTFELVKDNKQIQNLVGDKIMAHSEPIATRRRRSHVQFHTHYPNSGSPQLVTQYYIEGTRNTGTVHVCMTQINNEWKYKWLMVEVPGEGLPSRKVNIKGDETKFGGR